MQEDQGRQWQDRPHPVRTTLKRGLEAVVPNLNYDVSTTMIYTHVVRQGGSGLRSPLDCL